MEAIEAVRNFSNFQYTHDDLNTIHKDVTKFHNIIKRYGDGTVSQLVRALVEGSMGNRLLMEWRLHTKDGNTIPTVDVLLKFCAECSHILKKSSTEKATPSRPSSHRVNTPTANRPSYNKTSTKPPRPGKYTNLHAVDSPLCRCCKAIEHPLYQCQTFLNWDAKARRQYLQDKDYCFNSLNDNHMVKQCHSRRSCRDYGGRHHTLLHIQSPAPQQQPQQSLPNQSPATQQPQQSKRHPSSTPYQIRLHYCCHVRSLLCSMVGNRRPKPC